MAFSSFSSMHCMFKHVKNIVGAYIYNFPSIDPNLVFYYPMDMSSTVSGGVKTPNYASGLPVYDASMIGSDVITKVGGNYVMGVGDLSLNNTMGSTATRYVISNKTFATNSNPGFTVSLWFSCEGQLNTRGTLVHMSNGTNNGIEVDISGTNMIFSGWN